jgi:hypothetical protein
LKKFINYEGLALVLPRLIENDFGFMLPELVTINATPNNITIIASMVTKSTLSCSIAHPHITAITGLTYANVLASEAEVTLSNQ